jgi:hypothetical protein
MPQETPEWPISNKFYVKFKKNGVGTNLMDYAVVLMMMMTVMMVRI